MKKNVLGKTKIEISPLGIGLSEIGSELSINDDKKASELLNFSLDNGINFLDTASCYGVSEELIGRTVSHRRDEYYIASKAGHANGNLSGSDWSYETIKNSIDRSLKRLKIEYLDLIQLHSCDIDTLKNGECISAVQDAQKEGKTRFIGYSGDNDAAHWAVNSNIFSTLQTSFNLVEQRARTTGLLEKAKKNNMGIIIKRPIAGGSWNKASSKNSEQKIRNYDDPYLKRAMSMRGLGKIKNESQNGILTSMGYTIQNPNVDVMIIGTTNINHLKNNLDIIDKELPIDENIIIELNKRFELLDNDWYQRT
tara:strand:+ start:522 stop:1448 length:927 start_codon:yes stop_codon:yes gene_type:complete